MPSQEATAEQDAEVLLMFVLKQQWRVQGHSPGKQEQAQGTQGTQRLSHWLMLRQGMAGRASTSSPQCQGTLLLNSVCLRVLEQERDRAEL